jgi:molecular chaperone GrpE
MTAKHRQKHGKSRKPGESGSEAGEPRGNGQSAGRSEAGESAGGPSTDEQEPATVEEPSPAEEPERSGVEEQAAEAERAAEVAALKDRYLRLAAEYDNYRKRTERERAESWNRAQAQLVERMLEAIDDLQRVTHFDPATTSVGAVLEGVQLVERKLLRTLEAAGLEIVDAEGKPFDPEIHEALVSSPTEEREADDTVAEVFQKGYIYKGNLLRPARVRVYKHG